MSLLVAIAISLACGWLLRSGSDSYGAASGATGPDRPPVPRARPRSSGFDARGDAGPSRSSSESSEAEKIAAEVAAMSTDEFARELAMLVHGDLNSPAGMRRKAAFLEAMDPERANATYFEFKRLYGIPIGVNAGQELRNFLTSAGEMEGERTADLLLSREPDGVPEFDSFVHGWARGHPERAIAWFNTLPTEHPMYDRTFRGLFWGLVEGDHDFAVQAFSSLDFEAMPPRQLDFVGAGTAESMMQSHGPEGMNQLLAALPESMRAQAVEWSLGRVSSRPVAEVVPWLSDYAGESAAIQRLFRNQASRWASSSPEEAINWAGDFSSVDAGSGWRDQTFLNMAGRVGPQALQRWIAKHPDHPQAEAASRILQSQAAGSAPYR